MTSAFRGRGYWPVPYSAKKEAQYIKGRLVKNQVPVPNADKGRESKVPNYLWRSFKDDPLPYFKE